MEQDFNKKASALFDVKRKEFYAKIDKNDINSFMYVFGVNLRSNHYSFKAFDIVTPYAPIFKKHWDIDIWTKVTWGADDTKEDDVYEREFEEALNTMNVNEYLLFQAVKYHRPAWSIFGLLGMMQGCLNQNQFEVSSKEDVFTKEDVIRCMQYLPQSFLTQHKKDIEYLFTYFDERNYKLVIDDSTGNVMIESPT